MTLVERVARRIAAVKMGLVVDTRGERLPDDLWKQCEPDATAFLATITSDYTDDDVMMLALGL